MAAKPPTPRGDTVDSVPPATATSASPYSIMRPACPMQCSPVVHAVTTERLGPLKPKRMETWPATMLMMEAGTKKGVMRRGPRATNSAWVFSIRGKPPMPEPITQPMRVASSSESASPVGKPASSTACAAAAMPKWINVSIERASFALIYASTSKPLTSPAILQAKLVVSNLLIRPMPDCPARILAQASATVLPTGLIQPRPVTTTRRRLMRENFLRIAQDLGRPAQAF